MSIRETVFECPAYKVVEGSTLMGDSEYQVIEDGMTYAVLLPGRPYYRIFTAGSLMGCFATDAHVKIGFSFADFVKRDLEKGGKEHWLSQNSVCLTSYKEAQKIHHHLEVGAKVAFQGVAYTVETTHNDNLKLVKI